MSVCLRNQESMDSKRFDEILWQHLLTLPYFRGMLRALEHIFYLDLKLESPMLDLGVGDGHFSSLVFSSPLEFGLDPWRKPLLEAKQRSAHHLLVQAEGASIMLPDTSISTIISNSVLEHIDDLDPVLREVLRVLRPGGKFIFCVPNQLFLSDLWGQKIFCKLGLKKLSFYYVRFYNKIARHKHLDSSEVWLSRLRKTGFEIIDSWDYFPIEAMHMLETGHLFCLPSLFWKKIIGRWVLFPKKWNPFIPFKKIRRFFDPPRIEKGTCSFFVARRPE